MSDNVRHVMPNNDLIDHQEDEDCVCVPSVEHVTREDGSTAGWTAARRQRLHDRSSSPGNSGTRTGR